MDVQISPKLLPGRIVEITDMSVKIELKGRMGVLHLPLRSVFTDHCMAKDDPVEIYISCAKVLAKTA
jgi:hypothetical protein